MNTLVSRFFPKRLLALVGLAFVLLLSVAPAALAQCPMCKHNVESSMGKKDVTKKVGYGLNDGIAMLLAMPFLASGVIGFMWYKNSKRGKLEQEY